MSVGNQALVAMKRADGEIDSEVHVEGLIIKPNEGGVAWVPSQHVLSLIHAGYMWIGVTNTRATGDPAPPNA